MNPTFSYWYSAIELWRSATYAERCAYYLGLEWAIFGEYPATSVECWQSSEEATNA